MNTSLLRLLSDNWWVVLLRGIAAVLFGCIAFFWPGLTLAALVILFGAYSLIDGVLALAAAFRHQVPAPRWWLVLSGLLGLAAGIATFAYPGLTAVVLLVFVAISFLIRGVLDIIGAIQLRKEIQNEWLLILSGLVYGLFGFVMLTRPAAGALAYIWMIATAAVIFGVLLIGLSFRLRHHHDLGAPGVPHAA
jgi:uncharacterized membrane protein HdeD (DUF308 family)